MDAGGSAELRPPLCSPRVDREMEGEAVASRSRCPQRVIPGPRRFAILLRHRFLRRSWLRRTCLRVRSRLARGGFADHNRALQLSLIEPEAGPGLLRLRLPSVSPQPSASASGRAALHISPNRSSSMRSRHTKQRIVQRIALGMMNTLQCRHRQARV